jgi:hypothetical protein
MVQQKTKKLVYKTPLTEQLSQTSSSVLKRYQNKVFGNESFLYLLK